jgi:PAS domain S-box-containing protein
LSGRNRRKIVPKRESSIAHPKHGKPHPDALHKELERHAKHSEELIEERTKVPRESDEKYRTLMMNSPDAITVTDLEGKITDVSNRTLELHGFGAAEEILGKSAFDLVAPEDREKASINFQEIMKEGTKRNRVYAMLRKDGTQFPGELNSSVIKDADGNMTAFLITVRDITDRKRIEDELKKSEVMYRRLFESAQGGILILDSETGQITDVNPFLTKLMGYSVEDIVGKRLWEIGAFKDVAENKIAFDVLKEKGYVRYENLPLETKGGESISVEFVSNAYTVSGKKVIQCNIRDITDRKRIEEMKRAFVSAVTHDLRTPLVALVVHVDFLASGKLGSVPEKMEASLRAIKRSSDRLVRLVDDLLDIRRLESGKFKLSPQLVDLRRILTENIEEIEPLTTGKGQRLHFAVGEGPLLVQGDLDRLSQIVTNLLSNASKCTPDQGEITVKVAEEDGLIQVQVIDTGIGLRKEDLTRVFEPFANIQKPTHIKGTGLGLSLTKGLVEAHGGKIWAESEGEGKGSTFTFTLPRLKEEH